MKAADLRKPFRIVISGSSFLFFWGGGTVLSWLVLPIEARRNLSEAQLGRRCRSWLQWGFRVFHGYIRFWGLTDYNPSKVRLDVPTGPFVLVANHPSLIDVTALMSVVDDIAVVVKADYWMLFIKRALSLAGHINGGDGGALAAGSTAVQALEQLAEGRPVLIFPEGTRSPKDGLHDFQRGAFEIAKRARVPIVPVIITNNTAWLMKNQPWYDIPDQMNRMRIEPLQGVRVEPPDEDVSSKTLALRYHKLYKQALAGLLKNKQGSALCAVD